MRRHGAFAPQTLAVLAKAAFVFWLASVVVFVLLRLVPGDPVVIGLVERNQVASPENIAALRLEWGLSGSVVAQYLRWAAGLALGDWGVSLRTGRPVADEILIRLPWSLAIGGGGLLLAALASLPLGRYIALRPEGAVDRITRVLAIGSQAVPSFLVAFLLAWAVAAHLKWINVYAGSASERVVLPILVVALYSLPALARVVRTAFLHGAAQPHVMTARAKGLDRGAALSRHAGRPALLALLAALTPQAAWAIGGTAVVETVFAVPGVSQLIVESVGARDYAVLQLFVMLVAFIMVIVHAAAHVARALIDPRPVSWAAP